METRQTGVQHRAASREHQRLARAKLTGLRAELREALAAKKRRMAEIVASIRTQRTTLRNAMKQRRLEVRQELRRSADSARAVAREGFRQKKADARLETTSAIALARKDLLAERQHQAEQRRLDREERMARASRTKTVDDPRAHAEARAQAVAPFRSLFQKVKGSLRPASGESHEEAFLAYAESHPEVVHAHAEPAAERAIEQTKAEIAATERELVAGAVTRARPAWLSAPRKMTEREFEVMGIPIGPLSEAATVLLKKLVNDNAARKRAEATRDRVREQFSTGDYGGLSRSDFLKEYQRAEFDVHRREKALSVDENKFYKLTGREFWVDATRLNIEPDAESRASSLPAVARTKTRSVKRATHATRTRSKAASARATPPTELPSVDWRGGADDRILCSRCGCNGGQHRGVDGKCPSTDAWGRASRDPMMNFALEGAALDAAVARYWSANATFYRPVTATGPDEAVQRVSEGAPNAYEAKKAARVDRMRHRAGKLKVEAGGAYARAKSIASVIPLGQPILVGHHSEKRHRRDLERIDRGFRKSFELSKDAEALARRADSAERNTAVSSDDPNAVSKLRVKLAELNASRAKWKTINAAIRKGGDVVAALKRLGLSESSARELMAPDFAGRIGIPDYKLTNAGSEARRLEKRIAQLEAAAKAPQKPAETIGLARIFEEENRVRVTFPSTPPEPLRRALKAAGFRWSPTAGVWQRHASHGAWYDARRIAAATV